MKKVIFGLLATVLCASFSAAQGFNESVAMLPNPYLKTAKGYAQVLELKSFGNYKLLPQYAFNGVDFTDDGKNNDVKAGDGVYTSAYNSDKPDEKNPTKSALVSENFKYKDQLTSWLGTNRPGWGLTIHCKTRYVYTGTTILGFSCASGCIELYDCDVTFTVGGGYNRTK